MWLNSTPLSAQPVIHPTAGKQQYSVYNNLKSETSIVTLRKGTRMQLDALICPRDSANDRSDQHGRSWHSTLQDLEIGNR